MERIIAEIIFTYCYPRLDVNVSKGTNHLLKSPFSVHPLSRKVSVPIDVNKCDEFDLDKVPTLDILIEQLSSLNSSEKEKKNLGTNITC